MALMAANGVAVLKAAIRAACGEEEAGEMSAYDMALEIKQVYAGMMIARPPEDWTIVRERTAAQLAALLNEIAPHLDLDLYRKSKRGPKKPPPKKDQYRNGGHISTFKLLYDKKQ